jgi:hypothetical protein
MTTSAEGAGGAAFAAVSFARDMPAVENSPAIKRKVAEIKTAVLDFENLLIAVILLGSMCMRIGTWSPAKKLSFLLRIL